MGEDSTYVRRPPYLDGVGREPPPVADIQAARVLVKLGDMVTTDHISPAGAITSGHTGMGLPGFPWCESARREHLRVPQGKP